MSWKQINTFLSILTVIALLICFVFIFGCYAELEGLNQKFAEYDIISSQTAQTLYLGAISEKKADKPKEPVKVSLGIFTVTAYCPCETCCGVWSNMENPTTATGSRVIEGITVGADWGTIPAESEIYIEGLGKRVVEDKPAKWIIKKYDGKILDLFFSTHEEAVNFGKQQLEVWIAK